MPDLPDWMVEQLRGPQGEPGPVPQVVSHTLFVPANAVWDSVVLGLIPGTLDLQFSWLEEGGVGSSDGPIPPPPSGYRYIGAFIGAKDLASRSITGVFFIVPVDAV